MDFCSYYKELLVKAILRSGRLVTDLSEKGRGFLIHHRRERMD